MSQPQRLSLDESPRPVSAAGAAALARRTGGQSRNPSDANLVARALNGGRDHAAEAQRISRLLRQIGGLDGLLRQDAASLRRLGVPRDDIRALLALATIADRLASRLAQTDLRELTDGASLHPPSAAAHPPQATRPARRPELLAAWMQREQLPDASQLDLGRYSSDTETALYALTVAAYWSRDGEADEYEIPTFSPERAELEIRFWNNRWFATWRDLDQPPTAPIEDRQPLLHIEHSPDRPLGLSFSPC